MERMSPSRLRRPRLLLRRRFLAHQLALRVDEVIGVVVGQLEQAVLPQRDRARRPLRAARAERSPPQPPVAAASPPVPLALLPPFPDRCRAAGRGSGRRRPEAGDRARARAQGSPTPAAPRIRGTAWGAEVERARASRLRRAAAAGRAGPRW